MTTKKKQTTGRRRKTIGQNPLDGLLGVSAPKPARKRRAAAMDSQPEPNSVTESRATQQTKVRATFHIPADLIDECRNAVVHLSGPPERLTMARLAEDALRRELVRLRKIHTNGEPFPQRDDELRGGRPVGS